MERAEIARKYGFVDVRYQLFYRMRTLVPATMSPCWDVFGHIAMDAGLRAIYEKVAEAIDGTAASWNFTTRLTCSWRKPLV